MAAATHPETELARTSQLCLGSQAVQQLEKIIPSCSQFYRSNSPWYLLPQITAQLIVLFSLNHATATLAQALKHSPSAFLSQEHPASDRAAANACM